MQLSSKWAERQRRKEGLETSLFERAGERQSDASTFTNEHETTNAVPVGGGLGRALGIVLKMGWKPGQAMGQSSTAAAGEAMSEEAVAITKETEHDQGQQSLGMKRKRGSEEGQQITGSISQRISYCRTGGEGAAYEPIRMPMWEVGGEALLILYG